VAIPPTGQALARSAIRAKGPEWVSLPRFFMNIQEACGILEIPIGSSAAEVKAAFKKKAVEFHPDRNHTADAEEKFKAVNSAYQLLEKHGTNPPVFNNVRHSFYSSEEDFAEELRRQMGEVFKSARMRITPLVVTMEIPFETAVRGGTQNLTYTRLIKCDVCIDGKSSRVCPKCNGVGKRKYGAGAVQVSDRELPCTSCKGTGQTSTIYSKCAVCEGVGKKNTSETIPITIQPGMNSGTKIIHKGFGHYFSNNIYGDLIVEIVVKEHEHGLTLSGIDVISTVELSLLEALKGTKKALHTIDGEKVLEFKPKIKNGDRVRVSGFGVPPNGAHIFIVNITYPEDVSKVIEALEYKYSDSDLDMLSP
jgi:molecular chaperone DnaJ